MTITIPDNWSQVTISQFQELSTVDLNHKDYLLNVCSILVNKDPEELRGLDDVDFNQIVSKIEWTKDIPNEANFKQVINIDGQNYGLIKFSSLTNGEWIDLDSYIQDSITNLHKIFAILYREVIGGTADNLILAPYDTEDSEARANLFKDKLMIDNCYGALVFFSNIVNECTQTIQVYFHLLEKMRKIWKKQSQSRMKRWLMKESIKAGVGMPFFTKLQKENLLMSNRSAN